MWTDSELVVWGESTAAEGLGVGARWRPGDGTWRPRSPSPQGTVSSYEDTDGSQTVLNHPDADQLVITALEDGLGNPPTYLYDLSSDSWTPTDLPAPGRFAGPLIAAGKLFVPDSASLILGPVPP